MATLVPLNIDIESGRIVATGTAGGGPGPGPGPTPPVGALCAWGFSLLVPGPTLIWSVLHPLGTTNIMCQIYDISGAIVLPENIEVISNAEVRITFVIPQSGTANLTGLVNCTP